MSLVATATILGLYRLAAHPASPCAIPVAQVLLVLAFWTGPKGPQTLNIQFIAQFQLSSHNPMTQSQFNLLMVLQFRSCDYSIIKVIHSHMIFYQVNIPH